MKNKFCYWTISWGDYDYIAQTMINSARKNGVEEDFISFSEKTIKQCINLPLNKNINLDKLQFFKFEYLKQELIKLNYDYFIFIDADHFFVKKPNLSINSIMKESPWHSFLESPINSPKTQRQDWWQIPNQKLETFMKINGVINTEIRNSNGGFWICHRDFINSAYNLAYEFHNYLKNKGYIAPEEVSIAYLSHLMSPQINNRFVENFTDYWGADWIGNFKDRIPDGNEWIYKSYMTLENLKINPAIVHAMRSKKALIDYSKF